MKYLKIVTPIVFLLMISCSAQNKANNFNLISYEAQTRGSIVKIKIEDNKISYNTYNGVGVYKLSEEKLKNLNELVSELNLKEIKNLKAPTKNSATDRALIAKITFKLKDVEYTSSTFDSGNPPKELKKPSISSVFSS